MSINWEEIEKDIRKILEEAKDLPPPEVCGHRPLKRCEDEKCFLKWVGKPASLICTQRRGYGKSERVSQMKGEQKSLRRFKPTSNPEDSKLDNGYDYEHEEFKPRKLNMRRNFINHTSTHHHFCNCNTKLNNHPSFF